MQLVRGRIASIGWRLHSAVAAAAAVSWTIAADETAAELPAVGAVAAAAAVADAVAAGGDRSARVAAAAAGETQHSDDGWDGSHRPRVNCDGRAVHYHRRQLRHPSTQSRFPTPNRDGIRYFRYRRHEVHDRAGVRRRKMTVPID